MSEILLKTYIGLDVKCHYSCQTLIKFQFSRQIFKKSPNTKIHENPSVRAELFHVGGRADGRTNRHDEANVSFSQFLERA